MPAARTCEPHGVKPKGKCHPCRLWDHWRKVNRRPDVSYEDYERFHRRRFRPKTEREAKPVRVPVPVPVREPRVKRPQPVPAVREPRPRRPLTKAERWWLEAVLALGRGEYDRVRTDLLTPPVRNRL